MLVLLDGEEIAKTTESRVRRDLGELPAHLLPDNLLPYPQEGARIGHSMMKKLTLSVVLVLSDVGGQVGRELTKPTTCRCSCAQEHDCDPKP